MSREQNSTGRRKLLTREHYEAARELCRVIDGNYGASSDPYYKTITEGERERLRGLLDALAVVTGADAATLRPLTVPSWRIFNECGRLIAERREQGSPDEGAEALAEALRKEAERHAAARDAHGKGGVEVAGADDATAELLRKLLDEAPRHAGEVGELHYTHASRLRRQINKLAKDAGVGREGLTHAEAYLRSVRALPEDSRHAADIRQTLRYHFELSGEARAAGATAEAEPEGVAASAARVGWETGETFNVVPPEGREKHKFAVIAVVNDDLAHLGYCRGDHMLVDLSAELKDGALAVVYMKDGERSYIGHVRPTPRFFVLKPTGDLAEMRLRRTEVAHAGEVAGLARVADEHGLEWPTLLTPTAAAQHHAPAKRELTPEQERRVAELRRRLDDLYEAHDESARFQIEREIYEIEHGTEGGDE